MILGSGVPLPGGSPLPLYCGSERRVPALRSALGGLVQRIEFVTWEQLERRVVRSPASVVCADSFEIRLRHARIVRLLECHPHHSALLVTDRDAEALRLTAGLRLAGVVWFEEIASCLASEAAVLRAAGVLEWIADRIEASDRLTPLLRRALLGACRAPEAARSVRQLAETVGKDRRTLWRHWSGSFSGVAPVRLEDVLSLILIAHAVMLRLGGLGWPRIAARVPVHIRTLERRAHSLLGQSLRELAVAGGRPFMAAAQRGAWAELFGDPGRSTTLEAEV